MWLKHCGMDVRLEHNTVWYGLQELTVTKIKKEGFVLTYDHYEIQMM